MKIKMENTFYDEGILDDYLMTDVAFAFLRK